MRRGLFCIKWRISSTAATARVRRLLQDLQRPALLGCKRPKQLRTSTSAVDSIRRHDDAKVFKFRKALTRTG
jgi:hypothetical protein